MNRRNNLLIVCFASLTILVLFQYASSQEPDVQTWMGTMEIGGTKLRMQVDITNKDGKLTAVLLSPDQGGGEIKPDKFRMTAKQMSFEVKRLNAKFSGKLDETGRKVTGNFVQSGHTIPLTLEIVTAVPEPATVEIWNGILNAGAQKLAIQFRILESEDKSRTVVWDSLNEQQIGMPAEIAYSVDTVTFRPTNLKASFTGTFNTDKTELDGSWEQNGHAIPMKLTKSAKELAIVPAPKRPQTPLEPLPYDSKEVKFENKVDSVTLAGTLTLPKGIGPFPAVVLINGSGAHDRDVSIWDHKFFLVVADYLTRNRIAVLRFDERGVGQSTGDITKATTEDLARDVESGLDFLFTLPQITKTKVGLYGHSEGGLIAPMIAGRRKDVAWIVIVAGPGVSGRETIRNQGLGIAQASSADHSAIELGQQVNEHLFAIVETSAAEEEILEKLETGLDQFVEQLPDEKKLLLGDLEALKSKLASLNSPWFRFFLTYDPVPALQNVTCPVLVLNGEKDLQVDPELNIPAIKRAMSKNKNAEFHVLPGLNHMMQNCKTGFPSEYGEIEETSSVEFLELVANWINRQQ